MGPVNKRVPPNLCECEVANAPQTECGPPAPDHPHRWLDSQGDTSHDPGRLQGRKIKSTAWSIAITRPPSPAPRAASGARLRCPSPKPRWDVNVGDRQPQAVALHGQARVAIEKGGAGGRESLSRVRSRGPAVLDYAAWRM